MIQPKLTEIRGEIIEKFISIEKLVDLIISYHYFGGHKEDFTFDFLGDELFSFGLKRNILEKITGNDFQELRRLNNIRNIFAHCGGLLYQPNTNGPSHFPNPKDWKKAINFDEIYVEFQEKLPIAWKLLENEFAKMGGRFMSESENENQE